MVKTLAETREDSLQIAFLERQTQVVESQKQLYVLNWIPINEVNTKAMAAGGTDYTIETKQTFMDAIVSGLTFGIITVRTVTVSR